MRRILGFLVRNWPLKLGAVVLACVLYTGLVLGQNARTYPVQVPVQLLNQPVGAFNLSGPQYVTSVRLFAPPEVASQLTSQDFVATADLAALTPRSGGQPETVPVQVVSTDARVTVLDFRPRQISVRLDPIETKSVPVSVDRGRIPDGLRIGTPELDVSQVTVRGGSSVVSRVVKAVARVSIDPSGINVDNDVDLVAVDGRGDSVSPVDLTPAHVHVRIGVERATGTLAVPVRAAVTGAPATGYTVTGVDVSPPIVTLTGDPSALAGLEVASTAPIDVGGRTSDLRVSVALALPSGVRALGPGTVQVELSIAPLSGSRTFPTGLTLVGARPDRSYTLASPSVDVTLSGTVPALNAVRAPNLAASLDVSGLGLGQHTVTVTIRPPTGTSLVSISPSRVVVTVGAARTPSPGPTASPTPTPSPSAGG